MGHRGRSSDIRILGLWGSSSDFKILYFCRRIGIDRESEAIHDLILGLDEPGGAGIDRNWAIPGVIHGYEVFSRRVAASSNNGLHGRRNKAAAREAGRWVMEYALDIVS